MDGQRKSVRFIGCTMTIGCDWSNHTTAMNSSWLQLQSSITEQAFQVFNHRWHCNHWILSHRHMKTVPISYFRFSFGTLTRNFSSLTNNKPSWQCWFLGEWRVWDRDIFCWQLWDLDCIQAWRCIGFCLSVTVFFGMKFRHTYTTSDEMSTASVELLWKGGSYQFI